MTTYFFLLTCCWLSSNTPLFIHLSPDQQSPSSNYWKVERSDFNLIKKNLRTFVKENVNPNHTILKNWNDYTIQVVGATSFENEPVIFINAYCESPNKSIIELNKDPRINIAPINEQTQLVDTVDGGACYFNVWFDPISKTFTGFTTNEWGKTYPEK
ncbi:hypothetical protein [Acanthopleuribacter pedis]|uniref:Uncharacterized protein n=1 Tax=Acanthopleuribacter pedis TaxID=442870 RepID=A0A8J7U4W0_9BACT|nr:hypothetical protein [Acanthopleuribacter pedis]MBO1321062.1 hypothetical protein [Acanthopleuribacter pedis]